MVAGLPGDSSTSGADRRSAQIKLGGVAMGSYSVARVRRCSFLAMAIPVIVGFIFGWPYIGQCFSDTEYLESENKVDDAALGYIHLRQEALAEHERLYQTAGMPSRQDAAEAPRCSFTVAGQESVFDHRGGSGKIVVRTDGICTWRVSSDIQWLEVEKANNPSGSGEVLFKVKPNTSRDTRIAAITVAGRIFAITQSGVAQVSGSLSPGRVF
jgi:hypothetical protein